MFRRPVWGSPALLALGVSVALQVCIPVAYASQATKPKLQHTARGGFVKDFALARLLGETLYRDTADIMADQAAQAPKSTDAATDNSAVAQVARAVLAHQRLDKYIWLIQRAYDDAMWKGGDRARIEQHFPLIWRTSIMVYEASLSATPHRVRVCIPADTGGGFDCRDEISRPRMVPIPAQAPLIQLHQPTLG